MVPADSSLGIDLNVTPFHRPDDTHDIIKDDDDTVIKELNDHMSLENKRLKEMIKLVQENNSFLQNHVNKLTQNHDLLTSNSAVKRMLSDCNASEISKELYDHQESSKRPNNGISRIYRRITDESDNTMIVKDGYHWRKYGQKVNRDNPSPRAYYKCSFAPSCPVKKKVQRSVDDTNLLVAVYEGVHNHGNVVNEHTNSSENERFKCPMNVEKYDDQLLVEKMANSLRRNPNFIEELVTAIFSKVLE